MASAPFREIGRLSYSIYLWHWPVLVFARMQFGTLTPAQTGGCIALAIVLSVASLHFVENPIRLKKIASSRRLAFSLAAASSIAIAAFGAISVYSAGMKSRLPAEVLAINAASEWNMDYYRCFDPPGGKASERLMEMATTDTLCAIGDTNKPSDDFIVWGDSHAFAELPPFADLAIKHRLKGIAAMYPGCPSLINTINRELGKNQNCPAFFDAVLKVVRTNNIQQVFMVDRWSLYLLGEMKPTASGIIQFADDSKREKNLKVVFRQGIENTIAALGRRQIVFVKEPPTQPFYVTDAMATNAALGKPASHLDGRWTTLEAHRKRNAFIDETFAEIAEKHPNIRIVDPVATMCHGDLCSASRDGLPLYWDDDHFNHHGSKIVLEPLLSPIFEQLEMALRTTATVPMQ